MLVDVLVSEILIVSFDYNAFEPVVFTKLIAGIDPEKFNVSLSNAT